MLNQNVMLSIKGLMKNVHIVSVEKCSENGTINVADKLVMYGLAKNVTPKNQAALSKGISSRFITDVRVVDLTLPLCHLSAFLSLKFSGSIHTHTASKETAGRCQLLI